jgi:signal transduction histidine kinase/HAMP domain-containing protein
MNAAVSAFSNQHSIRRKLLWVVVTCIFIALALTGTGMAIYDLRSYRENWRNDLLTQAEILGRASAAALAFDDPKTAQASLEFLQARPSIKAAAIYTTKGALFATYVAPDPKLAHAPAGAQKAKSDKPAGPGLPFPRLPESDGVTIQGDEIVVFRRIVERGEILGTVYLRAEYELFERLVHYVGILGMVMVASLAIAILLSAKLHAAVIKPLQAIGDVAHKVMDGRDFTLRATKTTQDEVGYLVDAFNDMLAEVGRRTEVLEASNRALEREVAVRREAESALHDSERRNSTLVAAMTSVVWNADGTGRFMEEQSLWSAYTGQTRDDYYQFGWMDAFHDDDRAQIRDTWTRVGPEPDTFELELRLYHAASQRHRYVSVRAVPIIEYAGIREWIGTITDIDAQRRAEEDLHKLNAELEERVARRTEQLQAANKELEGFSYSVSHDLRAPLRIITGFAEMLEESHGKLFDEEGKRRISVIMKEANRMGLLIDDLLAFARLGRQSLKPSDIDIKGLAAYVFDRLHSQHDGPPVDFHIGALPHARADRALLEQVWANYLSNALKFTSKRERAVIEVSAISDEHEHIYFVRDNGAGFDPRYQAKLFGVFQRLHSLAEFPGNGVGLALVHRIVTRHGGRVWAESEPGNGATFYFTLPRGETNGTG